MVFVHGEDDTAAYWQDLVWRFESNGWSRERLVALQQPNPQARDDDAKEQAGRSSDAEHLAFVKAQVERVLAQTGAKQVVLVGSGRGAFAVRNYIINGGGDQTVSHAIFARPDDAAKGARGKLTLADYDGAVLKGVKSLVIPRAELRDGAFSPVAFVASYTFITGQEPTSLTIWPQVEQVLEGTVLGANDQAVAKGQVEIFAVQQNTGLRLGAAVYDQRVGADGHWGPFWAKQGESYEFVVRTPGYAVTHIYRSPFVRGSSLLQLNAERIADADLPAFSIIRLVRPRGLLDPTVTYLAFDGQSPPPGVPVATVSRVASSKITLNKLQNRAVAAEIHTDVVERVVGRTWPAKESHVVRLELSQ